jgi:hypothetical protein
MLQEAPKYMYAESSPYMKGTIKLTWIDPKNYGILCSKMFETLDEALKNTEDKKDWLVFRLVESDGDSYKWELLPYGESKSYLSSMKVSDFLEKYGLYVLLGLGIILISKKNKE